MQLGFVGKKLHSKWHLKYDITLQAIENELLERKQVHNIDPVRAILPRTCRLGINHSFIIFTK